MSYFTLNYFTLTDEDIVRQENSATRELNGQANSQSTFGEFITHEIMPDRQKAVNEARERLRAKGIDPDTL